MLPFYFPNRTMAKSRHRLRCYMMILLCYGWLNLHSKTTRIPAECICSTISSKFIKIIPPVLKNQAIIVSGFSILCFIIENPHQHAGHSLLEALLQSYEKRKKTLDCLVTGPKAHLRERHQSLWVSCLWLPATKELCKACMDGDLLCVIQRYRQIPLYASPIYSS